MATFNIELNKQPVRGGKGHALRLRITEKQQHARINLIYAVTPDEFNPKAKNGNFVRSFHKNHVKINTYLNDKIQIARDAYAEMDKKGEFISARTIKEKLIGKSTTSFTQYLDNHISDLLEMDQIGSYKKYKSTQTIVNEFTGRESILFQEIDVRFLKELEKHLLKTGRKQSTVRGYYVKIRALFNMAIQDGILTPSDNPFVSFQIKSEADKRITKNVKEALKLVDIELLDHLILTYEEKYVTIETDGLGSG